MFLWRQGANSYTLGIIARRQASDATTFFDTGVAVPLNTEILWRVRANWNMVFAARVNGSLASPASVIQAYRNQECVYQATSLVGAGSSPASEIFDSNIGSIGVRANADGTFSNYFQGYIRDVTITSADIPGSDAVIVDYSQLTKYGTYPVVPPYTPNSTAPSLDFSKASNSQYIPIIEVI